MNFVDLKTQYERIQADVQARIQAVLEHGRYVMGPEITELEERLAAWVGVRHGIAVASGTDALLIALMALDLGPGDEVITTPFTFIATAEAISQAGATPVFADIDLDSFNLDPVLSQEPFKTKSAKRLARRISAQHPSRHRSSKRH